MTQQVNVIMPYNACRSHAYIYDLSGSRKPHKKQVHWRRVPLVLDTEYQEASTAEVLTDGVDHGRYGVTCQVGGALAGTRRIFVHPDHVTYAHTINKPLRPTHHRMASDYVGIDYLRAEGFDAHMLHGVSAKKLENLPRLLFDQYVFFGVAELCMIVQGQCRADILDLVHAGCIQFHKRLATSDGPSDGVQYLDICELPSIAIVNGVEYAMALRYIDLAGLHGIASYRDLLLNTNFSQAVLDEKDIMHEHITRMRDAYFDYPEAFDRYALNDLHVYAALVADAEHSYVMHERLGLATYFRVPALTFGRRVADTLEAGLRKYCHLPPHAGEHEMDEQIEQDIDRLQALCQYGNAAYFRSKVDSTAAYLAKVFGGRCRSNRPTLARLAGVVVDLDLAGCYGQGLRCQEYPLGRPCVIHYEADSKVNAYQPLRAFLTRYEAELVPGLWTAIISTPKDFQLVYPQTLFPSWFPASGNDIRSRDTNSAPHNDLIQDLQTPSLEMAIDSGNTKIFSHQIHHGVLTSDGLEWIRYACSPAQRNELLDNLYVVAATYYKRSERVDTIEELQYVYDTHMGRNTCEEARISGLTTIIHTGQECYAWTSVNLGKLLVDQLLATRQLYPKKTSQNTLYKLNVNGLFGILVSPHFKVGNVIVGNNITARARAACWYMESGLHGVQSITDGVQFDLNAVPYPRKGRKRLTAQDVYPLAFEHALDKASHVRLAPLGDYDCFSLSKDGDTKVLVGTQDDQETVYRGKEIDQWINPTAMRHLQRLWPKEHCPISVLHANSSSITVANAGSGEDTPLVDIVYRKGQYEFEMKDAYTTGVFHSTANHLLIHDEQRDSKARSYRKRAEYTWYRLDHGVLVSYSRLDKASPAEIFLNHIAHNPHAIPRGEVYVVPKIIKPGYWKVRYRTFFKHNGLLPGGSYRAAGLLKEFSLSQFTMQTVDQWRALEKEYERSKQRYGQYVECFFLNADGTLDYARMLEEVQHLIKAGAMSLLNALDPYDHFARDGGVREHPVFTTLNALKTRIEEIYLGTVDIEVDPFDNAQDDTY